MSTKKIHLKNKNRILLSEILPREVPYIFTNRFLYSKLNNIKYTYNNLDKNYIPFNYKIKKNIDEYRVLTIMHPKVQIEFIEFYEKYKDLILYYCNISPFSLRKPISIRKSYKIKDLDEIENKKIDEQKEPNISYFLYKKYDIKAKFFDSQEFIRLEKKFKYLIETDISKCFYNIYTHSISWAIKDKEYSKKNIKNLNFENDFDKLMQNTNYRETNGIIVGPEISRIFAEIILQRIDMNIINKLKTYNLINEINYTIRRYVDDYFVYFSDMKNKDLIINTIKEELEFYKLYLNEQKTVQFLSKPFITNITIAKNSIKKLFNNDFFKNDKNYNFNSVNFIEDFKSVIFNNKVSYASISGYTISCILKIIKRLIKKFNKNNIKYFIFKMFNILDILFFIYTMDIRFENTNKITEILLDIKNLLNKDIFNFESKDLILKKIRDEMYYLIKNNFYIEENVTSETLNFLIAFVLVVDDFYNYLTEQDLRKIFDIKNLNYFQIITLIFICKKNKKIYKNLLKEVNEIAIKKIQNNNSAEDIMLYCDFKYGLKNKNIKLEGLEDIYTNLYFVNFDFKIDDLKLKIKMSKKNIKETY